MLTVPAVHVPADEDWRHQASCRDVDPNMMQPEVASADEVELALRVCDGCPVRDQCEQLAEAPGAYGVHAGKWYGDPPRNPAAARCTWCGCAMPERSQRSTRAYCDARCRKAAQRAREQLSA